MLLNLKMKKKILQSFIGKNSLLTKETKSRYRVKFLSCKMRQSWNDKRRDLQTTERKVYNQRVYNTSTQLCSSVEEKNV